MPDPDAPDQNPTGQLPPGLTAEDAQALEDLAAAGWGEGDHEDPHIPDGLLELHVAIEADEAGLL